MSDPVLSQVLAKLDSERAATEASLIEWLRIPSVSAQPAHAPDCRKAGQWLVDQLTAIGFTAALEETGGHPVVRATHPGPGPGANVPRVLIYGHYDVQPAEPFELWHTPPFEPSVVDGPLGKRVVARGAVDDKGQCVTWLAALRAWHAVTGAPPLPITILVEGEEEVGSVSLDGYLTQNRDRLKADIALISDTGMWNATTPAISTSLRGLLYVQIDLKQAVRDLHSGMFGGSAGNVLNTMTKVLGGLHDENGRITIPRFYDGIPEASPEARAALAALDFDEKAFLADQGLSVPVGEKDRSPLERLWTRPTADINGIWGGYTGAGSKTVIAAEGHAKLSFRLVPGQDPDAILAGLREWLDKRLPADATYEIQVFGKAVGIAVPTDSDSFIAAREALTDEFGKAPVMAGCGGSIPVVDSLKRILGLDTLLVGFGLDDDQVHSPNEKFELTLLHAGARAQARLMHKLAGG
ncbi:M20/M25/M40 family metallo-hydrolase [Acetobacteraceae bacterium H6797]|nr:M20/M25/M40 family metallo-hydrolase [Acetobacteraceae bacterium H6797]